MIFYNKDFVTTTSRVTPDGKYPEWYLPPGYRVEFDPNSGNDQDLMSQNKDFCFFASTERYMTWSQLPTSDEDDGSLAILGTATLDYSGNEHVVVYMARFKWEGSSLVQLSWLRDVYQFSEVVPNHQSIVDNKMAFAFWNAKIEQVWAFDDNNTDNNFTISNQNSLVGTFAFCNVFNQELSWDTSNVTDMGAMFNGASVFNKPVNFNTSNVTNMRDMFNGAKAFNKPVNFNTSNVTNMGYMFYEAEEFDQPVNFNTSNVTNMRNMFRSAKAFNSPVNFTDTSNVNDMSYMFYEAEEFDQPINFNTANVNYMAGMFASAYKFNSPVNFIDTSNVLSMYSMFRDAYEFNKPLNFDTSNVTDMAQMFYDARVFNQNISSWCVENILDKPTDFDTNSGFENQSSDQPRWGVLCSDINVNGAKHYFVSSRTVTASDLPASSVSGLTLVGNTNGGYLYSATFNWDNTAWKNLSWLVDVRKFAGNKITNGKLAFVNSPATQFTALPDLDTSDLTDMEGMFYNCENFNQSINFDARNVTDMNNMFSQAYEFNSPLILTNTGSVTSMNAMFYGTIAFNQPLDFDTSSVNDMNLMFVSARAFDQDISDWCVPLIPSKPSDFDNYSGFENQTAKQPQWGVDCGFIGPPPPG
jgi:surface protein